MAAQAHASSVTPQVINAGSAIYLVSTPTVTASAITYSFKNVSSGSILATTSTPYYPQACNMLSMADGVQIGWLIGAAWLATFAILFIAKAIYHKEDSNYGNA